MTTSIANITATDTTFSNDLVGAKMIAFDGVVDKGTQSSATTVDWNDGNHQKITISGDFILEMTDPTHAAAMLTLRVSQDGTGGRTLSLPTMKWPRGNAPTLSTSANSVDIITIMWDGSDYYASIGQGYA